jgi:hypothetical protein
MTVLIVMVLLFFLLFSDKFLRSALSSAFYPPKPVGESRAPGGQWDPSLKYKQLYQNMTFPRPPYNVTQDFQALPKIFRISEVRYNQRWKTGE